MTCFKKMHVLLLECVHFVLGGDSYGKLFSFIVQKYRKIKSMQVNPKSKLSTITVLLIFMKLVLLNIDK